MQTTTRKTDLSEWARSDREPRRSRPGTSRRRQRRALILIAPVVLGCLAAGFDVLEETQISASAAAADQQAIALGQGDLPPIGSEPQSTTSPRASVYEAVRLGRDAARLPTASSQRQHMLGVAANAARTAVAARPAWGEAQVAGAYIAQLSGDDAQALKYLSASYGSAAFLRQSAFWRIGLGVSQWNNLSSATRIDVVDEALWLRSVAPDRREEINDFMRNSAAYATFILRSSAARTQSAAP